MFINQSTDNLVVICSAFGDTLFMSHLYNGTDFTAKNTHTFRKFIWHVFPAKHTATFFGLDRASALHLQKSWVQGGSAKIQETWNKEIGKKALFYITGVETRQRQCSLRLGACALENLYFYLPTCTFSRISTKQLLIGRFQRNFSKKQIHT